MQMCTASSTARRSSLPQGPPPSAVRRGEAPPSSLQSINFVVSNQLNLSSRAKRGICSENRDNPTHSKDANEWGTRWMKHPLGRLLAGRLREHDLRSEEHT